MTGDSWIWVLESVVLAVHDEQLAEHGGMAGVRDMGHLLSALVRPQNLVDCGDPDAADLAASYAVGIARNHPFLDGNERTALVVAAGLFLPMNGYILAAPDKEGVCVMLAVAEGSMPEKGFAAWLRANIRAIEKR